MTKSKRAFLICRIILSFRGVCATRNLMVFMKSYYVYLLTNWNNRVIYAGVTNDLNRRIYEHKNKLIEGFSKKYNLTKLVYFEETSDKRGNCQRKRN